MLKRLFLVWPDKSCVIGYGVSEEATRVCFILFASAASPLLMLGGANMQYITAVPELASSLKFTTLLHFCHFS